jgi:3-methyladenine DNA glycosylase AlkD
MVAKAADMQPMAEAVAEWRTAERLWQRRASAVAFVGLASQPEPYPGFRDLLFAVCSANAADPTRWSQTSVGWLLRELSDADPRRVEAFVDAHPHLST